MLFLGSQQVGKNDPHTSQIVAQVRPNTSRCQDNLAAVFLVCYGMQKRFRHRQQISVNHLRLVLPKVTGFH